MNLNTLCYFLKIYNYNPLLFVINFNVKDNIQEFQQKKIFEFLQKLNFYI